MYTLNQKLYKIAIVSKKARAFVELPVNAGYDIDEPPSVKERLIALIEDKKSHPLLVALFITVDECNELQRKLDGLMYTDIVYQYIIFGKLSEIGAFNLGKSIFVSEFRCSGITAGEFDFIAQKTFAVENEFFIIKSLQEDYLDKLIDTHRDQEDLINIGKALSSEKDQNNLLRLILFLSKKITGADAGSIYLVEEDENGAKRLRFKYSHTFSREVPLEEFTMAMNKKSIAGYVAVTGEVLNIPDAYKLPPDAPYSFNSSFDKTHEYLSRSMLVVPMRNHVDEIIGVIQLLNSKENKENKSGSGNEAFEIKLENMNDFAKYVVSFNQKYDSLLEAIAGQAAVAIENNRLIKQIQNQFEEFVKASVTAIESRDPATSGHSFRVAEICKAMAYAINEIKEGPLADVHFDENDIRELEFAALLHDFGKVYIDLAVFKKAKKLYEKDFENLVLRLDYLYRFLELQFSARESDVIKNMSKENNTEKIIGALMEERKTKLIKIREIKERLIRLNEPAIMEEDPAAVICGIVKEIDEIECQNVDGKKIDIISELDRKNLCIRRGSLNEEERKEIQSHVVHTYNFVSKIPWPPEYKNIPEIALRHHETLDGKGYPHGLLGKESTLIQSRMMTIADIYDALAASDRPYKKAVPLEKVLAILRGDAQRGVLDKDLVEVFINFKIYEKVSKDSFRAAV